MAKQNKFSNYEFLCRSDASHQLSVQSNLGFVRCRLKNFKMAAMVAILDGRMERFTILNLYVTLMPPLKFKLNPTYDLGDVS